MRIKVDKVIVPYKLTRELLAVEIALTGNVGLLPNGVYIPLTDETQADDLLPTIETVIEAHDGIDDVAVLVQDAEDRVRSIPGWATWTEAQALEWFTDNIEPLNIPAEVKTLLFAYGRVLLALRDKTWPEL